MNRIFLGIMLLIFVASCTKKYNEDFAVGQNEQQNQTIEAQKKVEQSFTKANQIINIKEKENIQAYIKRNNWQMSDKNGVYFQLLRNGNGKQINDSSIVSVACDVFLLNGSRYGEKNQKMTFNIKGDTQVPFGVMTAVKGLKDKSKLRVIIPSNLAFTISQEGEKIEQDNTLIYIIDILEVK